MKKLSLTAVARTQLESAQASSSGRSARTVIGGHEQTLRQTVIALTSGAKLDDHLSGGEAALYVLKGRVRLASGEDTWDGMSGDLLVIPREVHSLEALEDSAVLLTVARG